MLTTSSSISNHLEEKIFKPSPAQLPLCRNLFAGGRKLTLTKTDGRVFLSPHFILLQPQKKKITLGSPQTLQFNSGLKPGKRSCKGEPVKYLNQGFVGGRSIIRPPENILAAKIQTFILNNWARFIAPQYTPYVFCSRHAFNKAGGWPEGMELGDELVFQRNLKRNGRLAFDKDSFVDTSPRRYQSECYLKTTMLGILVRG